MHGDRGVPWLAFYGTQCALVWAKTRREARGRFHVEWGEQHPHRSAPRTHEVKLRRLALSDEWWLLPQAETQAKGRAVKQWVEAFEILRRAEAA